MRLPYFAVDVVNQRRTMVGMVNRQKLTPDDSPMTRARWSTIEKYLVRQRPWKTPKQRLSLMNELYVWTMHLDMIFEQDEQELADVRTRWVWVKELYAQDPTRFRSQQK